MEFVGRYITLLLLLLMMMVGVVASRGLSRGLVGRHIQLLGRRLGDADDLLVEACHFLLVLGGQLITLLGLADECLKEVRCQYEYEDNFFWVKIKSKTVGNPPVI